MSLSGFTQGAQSGASSASTGVSDLQGFINGNQNAFQINPVGMKGIAGFLFHEQDEQEMRLESEIPDHWMENNLNLQDHVAHKPIITTFRGFICETVAPLPNGFSVNGGVAGNLAALNQKLTTTTAYLGKYTPAALQKLQGQVSGAVSKVQGYTQEVSQYLNRAQSLLSMFGGNSGAKTAQQKAYAALSGLWSSYTLFNVLTPWTLLKNMQILNLVLIQPKETEDKSDIAITMKQMNFVDNISSLVASGQGRYAHNMAPQTNLGTTSGFGMGTPAQNPSLLQRMTL